MSEKNVEVVRAAFDAWNKGDMPAMQSLYDPDAILRLPEDWPEPGPFVGREAVFRQFARLRDPWAVDSLNVVSDFVEGADRVAARVSWDAAGQGPEAKLEATAVFTLRQGKIVSLAYSWDHDEALEAAGLSE